MRILLSLIALLGVIAIADVGLSPSANATVLTTDVHALKTGQTSVVENTIVVAIIAAAIIVVVIIAEVTATATATVAAAGGVTAGASAVGDEVRTLNCVPMIFGRRSSPSWRPFHFPDGCRQEIGREANRKPRHY